MEKKLKERDQDVNIMERECIWITGWRAIVNDRSAPQYLKFLPIV